MNRDVERLREAIGVAARAAARLRSSLLDDAADLDLAIVSEGSASDRYLLNILDSFVQRFQQVHEHMTHRVYPAMYRLDEASRPPPMLQLLIWLEQRGLIDERLNWGRYAEARNRLVHEYPLEATDRAEALRLAVEYSAAMLRDFDRLVEHVRSRGLLDEAGREDPA